MIFSSLIQATILKNLEYNHDSSLSFRYHKRKAMDVMRILKPRLSSQMVEAFRMKTKQKQVIFLSQRILRK